MYGKRGSETPNWKAYISQAEREESRHRRLTSGHDAWARDVKRRANYTCEISGESGVPLESHHMYDWITYKEHRVDINNGACICLKLHELFHFIYGRGKNTPEQFYEFKAGLQNPFWMVYLYLSVNYIAARSKTYQTSPF